jgi:subtilisin family serine protease
MAGIAWQTPVMALKALNSTGSGDASAVAEAILYAADNGARVINISLGSEESFQVIADAAAYALVKGCLLAAAAGNSAGAVEYPAALPGVLAVSATDNNDIPAQFSNRGPQVDLAAPGVDIFSANKSGSYSILSGTSMSTAHISGVATLLWSLRPDWTAIQVSQALTTTVVDVWAAGRDDLTGWGRVNAAAAVESGLFRTYIPIYWATEEEN